MTTPEAVLRRRAIQLAAAPPAAGAQDMLQVLEFTVAGRACAIELRWIREVRALPEPAALPFAAQHVLGVCNLRGRMLPVLELASVLGLAAPKDAKDAKDEAPPSLLVLGRDGESIGFAAGAIGGLATVSLGDIGRRSAPLEGLQHEAVRGLTSTGAMLLDGAPLVAVLGAAA